MQAGQQKYFADLLQIEKVTLEELMPWAGNGCYEGGDHWPIQALIATVTDLVWRKPKVSFMHNTRHSYGYEQLLTEHNQEETLQELNVSWMVGKEKMMFAPYQLDSDLHPLWVAFA